MKKHKIFGKRVSPLLPPWFLPLSPPLIIPPCRLSMRRRFSTAASRCSRHLCAERFSVSGVERDLLFSWSPPNVRPLLCRSRPHGAGHGRWSASHWRSWQQWVLLAKFRNLEGELSFPSCGACTSRTSCLSTRGSYLLIALPAACFAGLEQEESVWPFYMYQSCVMVLSSKVLKIFRWSAWIFPWTSSYRRYFLEYNIKMILTQLALHKAHACVKTLP